LHFLQAPAKLEKVTTGKVARRLGEVDAMLKDPDRTRIVLVALPEELPARETIELAGQRDEEGFPLHHLVVNRMPPPVPFETTPAGRPKPSPNPTSRALEGPHVGSVGPDEALALLAAERDEAEDWLDELQALDVDCTVVPSLPGRPDPAREVATFVEGIA
jgi:anion-transporting  ArsA/GET3 family ATPase